MRTKKWILKIKKWTLKVYFLKKGIKISLKTADHIHKLHEKFGCNEAFGRSAFMELLKLKSSGVSKLLTKLVQGDIIESVSGYGKEKYKFKKQ